MVESGHGKIVDGKVVFYTPTGWPEGAEVRVELTGDDVGVGLREKDWPTTTEGIAELLYRIDTIKPFLTLEEEAEWKKALADQKAWEIAHWEEHCRKLEKLFE